MAAYVFCRLEPFVMILDPLAAQSRLRVARGAFVIAHNQHRFDAEVTGSLFHLGQVLRIVRLVHEEYIDVLDGVNAEGVGLVYEIEIIQFGLGPAEKPFVPGPLS